MPGTVSVACKIPSGLMLRVFAPEKFDVPVMAGGVKTMTRWRPTAWSQKLNGPARKIGQDVDYQIVHGAGLTHGVDADQFAIWLDQNKDTEMVRLGLVFGQAKANDVIQQANEHRSEKTGLEAVDPNNLPAEFKRKIETAVAA
jgi:hypothetical protein